MFLTLFCLVIITGAMVLAVRTDMKARRVARAMQPVIARLVDIETHRKVSRAGRRTRTAYVVRMLFDGPGADTMAYEKTFSFRFTANRFVARFTPGTLLPVKPNIATPGRVFLPGEEQGLNYPLLLSTAGLAAILAFWLVAGW